MRFLIDTALDVRVAEGLRSAGHDAVHTRDLGMASAADEEIFSRARAEDRIVLSADTDFGTLLARTGERKPSVILFRVVDKRFPNVIALLGANLGPLEQDLTTGCIAVFEDGRIRVRRTPIAGGSD